MLLSHQVRGKTKTSCETRQTFSRALRQLNVLPSSFDWLMDCLCPLWLARVITLEPRVTATSLWRTLSPGLNKSSVSQSLLRIFNKAALIIRQILCSLLTGWTELHSTLALVLRHTIKNRSNLFITPTYSTFLCFPVFLYSLGEFHRFSYKHRYSL